MAAPKLKVNAPAPGARPKLAVAAAPTSRPKLATGAAPTKRPTLLGAGGQAIKPKEPTPAPTPEPEVTPAVATPQPAPAPEPVAAPAPEPTVDTAAAEAAAKAEAEAAAAAEAAAKAEAEAAAAAEAAAQAEYERQMEEYNRQMEEYNRQMAEYQAQQEAAAAETAPAPEPDPTPEPTPEPAPAAAAPKPAALKPKAAAPKPAALKPKAAAPKPAALRPNATAAKPALAAAKPNAAAPKPAAAPAAASEPQYEATEEPAPAEAEDTMSEEQLSARDAYLQQLQTIAEKKPFHKTPLFYVALGSLVALGIGCFFYVSSVNAERNARKAKIDATNAILKRASEINKMQIETMDDAKAKNYTVVCSKEDAQCLLNMVVDPFAKDEYGRPAYGGAPKQTAQLACLLLALASEMDPSIDNLIFSTLDKNAPRMDSDIYNTLIQRMAVSNNKGINAKFRKLADSVAAKPKWTKKATILAHIWECMGLRVTEKDIPDIINLLKGDDLDSKLADALSLCLQNIIMMEDDTAKKAQLGDKVFEAIPPKYLIKMQGALGRACSPKALEHFRKEAESPDKWRDVEFFFANYYSDDIVPYLVELKAKGQEAVDAAGDDKNKLRKAMSNLNSAEHMLSSVVGQNRDRKPEDAQKLIDLIFDKLNVPDDAPEEDLDASYKQKTQLLNALAGMHDHPWVLEQLDKLYNDPDAEISMKAGKAKERVKKNAADDALMHSKYKARDKQ